MENDSSSEKIVGVEAGRDLLSNDIALDKVVDELDGSNNVPEGSFLVEDHNRTLENWGGVEVELIMAEPVTATERADYHAAQIVAGNDSTEAGKALVADLMKYELYRAAFKESAFKFYDEMPANLKPSLDAGLKIAEELIIAAENRYGVVSKSTATDYTAAEIDALDVKYGSRIDLVSLPELQLKNEPLAFEVHDKEFGLLGVFQGDPADIYRLGLIKIDQKEQQKRTLENTVVPIVSPVDPGPQPLNFNFNGQPASLNLQDYLPGQLPEATVIRPILPVAPPLPIFTHNGQPATLRAAPAEMTVDPAVPIDEPGRVDPIVAPSVIEPEQNPVPSEPLNWDAAEAAATSKMLDALSASSEGAPHASSEPSTTGTGVEAVSPVASPMAEPSVVADTAGEPLPAEVAIEQEVRDPLEVAKAVASSEGDTEVPPSLETQDLAALLPRRFKSKTEAEPSAEVAIDAINVGPRIGVDEPPAQPTLIDKDALLTRITHESQNDNSVLYKLDNEPAFVDRGSRLEMVPGAGQSDEKIMAALLTAARFYRGQIELTGSDAFKTKAIELIAQHQINVSMKNPAQQLMLDEARKAQAVTAEKPDAVMGDTPPPYDPAPAPLVSAAPVAASQPVSQPAPMSQQPEPRAEASAPATLSLPEHLIAPDPMDDSAYSGYMPPETHGSVPPALAAEKPPALTDKLESVDPSVHQSCKAAKDGVTGKVMGFGPAPFRFDPENQESVYIKLRTKTGTQTFWGKELAGLLRQTRIEQGRMATLQWLGEKDVVVQAPVRDKETGKVVRWVEKEAKRNQWSLSPLNGPAVRTGDDQGVKLAAYDAARFALIQNSVMAQLNVPIDVPSLPRDGLFWITPNGQGSAKTGDELSAPRPVVEIQDAGKLVMSSWSQDGQLDMALFRGDGPYLQGVVRQGEAYQHVLASLPGHPEAPPMVINMITDQGLVPIGVGNGINRSSGESVSREHVAYRLEGDTATRIAKLDFPAEVPPALHHRLGFDERWKDTNFLPKSAPAAAPVAQPGAVRPS